LFPISPGESEDYVYATFGRVEGGRGGGKQNAL